MPPRRGPLPRSPRPSRPGLRGDGSGRPRSRGPGIRRPCARRPGAGHGLFVVPPAVVVAPSVRREALSRGHVGCVDGRAVAAYARVSRWERVRQRRGLRFGCGKHDVSLATPRPAARSSSTADTVHRRRCGWNSCTAPVIFADNARGAPPCSGEAPLCGARVRQSRRALMTLVMSMSRPAMMHSVSPQPLPALNPARPFAPCFASSSLSRTSK